MQTSKQREKGKGRNMEINKIRKKDRGGTWKTESK